MTDSNYTAFALIMDRSGSMGSIRPEAEGAINAFVKEQQKLPGKATLTFAQFDHNYELVFNNMPIAEVTDVKLVPRGTTALLDAVGRTVVSFGESLAAMPEDERPGKVLVVIVTDGYENASHDWTKPKIKELLTEQQEKWNWEIIYLAANVDTFDEAQQMGVPMAAAKPFVATPAGMKAGGQSMATYAASYRTEGVGTWDDDDSNDT